MSASREWRVTVLALAVLLSLALIWRPWEGLAPQLRGLKYGIDIVGGSRIRLSLNSVHVTLENIPSPVAAERIEELFENELLPVKIISDYDPRAQRMVLEVGRLVTSTRIENIIGDLGDVERIERRVHRETREEVMYMLQMRVDPYGMLGTEFTPEGEYFIKFEVAGLTPERARELLGRQGRVEAFIGEQLVWRGEDLVRVGSTRVIPGEGGGFEYHVPFEISDEAAERFAEASRGKPDHPLAIYLDRPEDAIIIFRVEVLRELQLGVRYQEDQRRFRFPFNGYEYYLCPGGRPAFVGVEFDSLSPAHAEYLEEQRGLRTRVIMLGENGDFGENLVDELVALGYSIEFLPRLKGEPIESWLWRASGLKSTPRITAEIAGRRAKEVEIEGTRLSEEAARLEGKDLEMILSQRLPVEISFETEELIEPRLGREFRDEAIRAALIALAAVAILIFLRYRRPEVTAAIIGAMFSELIITLGIASLFGWSIGLPEIGGLIAVIGTGVDHQIIITDEIVRGGLVQAERVSFSLRIKRAFSIIFAAAATTVAAMLSLATVGFGRMRGFALITISGLLVAVLLTRPAYAKIISSLLERRLKPSSRPQA